ncbi:DUF397 domain-containing protein [Streptomyces sp. NPDC058686]|uniref:DUF397 domain-containing protein n=1 Tax=Streptomyces sp. NPDC058686 TaxID=3346599 RepID=UPI00365465C1
MSTALQWFKSSYSSEQGGQCLEAAYEWRKSSYSGSDGGNCLEVAHDWRKSTYSSEQGGACLEVSPTPAAIHIRDSKNIPADTGGTGTGIVTVTPEAWVAFLPLARRSR